MAAAVQVEFPSGVFNFYCIPLSVWWPSQKKKNYSFNHKRRAERDNGWIVFCPPDWLVVLNSQTRLFHASRDNSWQTNSALKVDQPYRNTMTTSWLAVHTVSFLLQDSLHFLLLSCSSNIYLKRTAEPISSIFCTWLEGQRGENLDILDSRRVSVASWTSTGCRNFKARPPVWRTNLLIGLSVGHFWHSTRKWKSRDLFMDGFVLLNDWRYLDAATRLQRDLCSWK